MRAILIDVQNHTITEVEQNGLDDMYSLCNCETIDFVRLDNEINCVVDDEGLIKQGWVDENDVRHNLSGFTFGNLDQVIMGNGLIIGINQEGDTIDLSNDITIELVKSVLKFVDYDNNDDKPQPFMDVIEF